MNRTRPIRIVSRGDRGLTLVELIVTVAILSILASAAVPVNVINRVAINVLAIAATRGVRR